MSGGGQIHCRSQAASGDLASAALTVTCDTAMSWCSCTAAAMALTMRVSQTDICDTWLALALLSFCALLLTLVLLFGLQGEQIMRQPVVIALLAVPIIVQVYFNAGLAYWLNKRLGVERCVAGQGKRMIEFYSPTDPAFDRHSSNERGSLRLVRSHPT